MMHTGIRLAICYMVVLAIRATIYDNDVPTVMDVILGALLVVIMHFIAEILRYGIRTRRYLPPGSTTTAVKHFLAAAAASLTRGDVKVPRLKVTMPWSQMTATVMVPRSHTLTQTLHFVSSTGSSAGVQEPTLKVTMKLPHGGHMTLMQPGSKPFTQTFGMEV